MNGKEIIGVNAALPVNVRVHSVLGAGAQGTVYRGSVNGSPAAVKLYNAGQTVVRIDREVDALARLNSPAIAGLLWSGNVQLDGAEVRVVATELIEGRPLDQLVGKGRLSDVEVSALVRDVAKAIAALWAIRVVHRDLKPSNIMWLSSRFSG